MKEGATKGIDAELGEINLYGREPQGDLDIRIIRRVTEKGWFDGDPAPVENIELKIDYRFFDSLSKPLIGLSTSLSIVLKVVAKHYPVSIYLMDITGVKSDSIIAVWVQYKEDDGTRVGNWLEKIYVVPPLLLYTFNEPANNNLIWLSQAAPLYVSIENAVCNQPLFPNPSKDYVIIENGRIGERFEVLNTEGRIISSLTIETYPFKLDISNLPKGTYFLRNKNSEVINKFIKE